MTPQLFLTISMLIFIKLILIQNQAFVYNPYFIMKYVNNPNYNYQHLQFILNSLSKTFQDAYAFNEISKNPPQPKFSQNYFKKVDMQKRLKEININNATVYKYFQDLKRALADLEDLHIQFDLSKYFRDYLYLWPYQPLTFYIKLYNNKPRIFGSYDRNNYIYYFRNYQTVYNVIQANLNVPIYSINGKDPFYYITNFGNEYLRLKSPYATFTYKYMNHKSYSLYMIPLSLEDLTNFTVVYDNNETFNTDYIIVSQYNLTQSNDQKSFLSNNLKDNTNNFNFTKNNLEAKIDNFEMHNFILGNNSTVNDNNNGNKLKEEGLKWDYNYNNISKCRVDDKNQVNVYLLKGLGDSDNINNFFQAIEQCVKLFDNNTYPIVLINSFNPGGIAFLAHILIELLSPKISLNMYGAFRKTSTFKNYSQLNEYFSLFANSENCEKLTYDHLIKKENRVNYSEDISDVLTEPFIILKKDIKERINEIKKTLKNPRKPTDILVLTDGFSYSSAAMFLKYLQYYGGAITAGYFINPNISDIPFDSSLSPSITFDYLRLQLLSPEGYKPLYDFFKWGLSIPGIQTFYRPDNYSIPLEYEVTPVDEKIDIYEIFDDSNYELFVNESLKLLNKYKGECNPNNQKLILFKNECDESFGNKYTHGGYQCGGNGKWVEKCVASYCDIGYIFDYNKQQCIIDVCSERENKENEHENENNDQSQNKNEENSNTFYYIFYPCLIIFIFIIIVIVFIIIRKNRKTNLEIENLDNGNLVEN